MKKVYFMATLKFMAENITSVVTVVRDDGIPHFPWNKLYKDNHGELSKMGVSRHPSNMLVFSIREMTKEEYDEYSEATTVQPTTWKLP